MIGNEIYKFAKELWGIDRSLTGEGNRETLNRIKEHIPNLAIKSVPTGTSVLDWTIPKEWKVNNAYIITPSGEKICDFSTNNLHLVGYSTPIKRKINLNELQDHLYSISDQPNAIPYVTSYYSERWGFCIAHEERENLKEGEYEVVVDTELFDGVLNYGELMIRGESKSEIFLSTYICHPSMANNELSGPTVLTFLSKWLQDIEKLKYSYRIVFLPETIGSITYLSKNLNEMKRRVIAGFNLTCIGDNRTYSYLPSRNENTLSDNVAKHVLKWTDPNFKLYKWTDRQSDERQYCAPGIDLPVASIMRTKYGSYPEYHTSLDDLENVVSPEGLNGGYLALQKSIELIENNEVFKTTILGEPQLSKRGLYPDLSIKNSTESIRTMMNFLSYCDGTNTLLEIAEKINTPSWDLYDIVETLKSEKIIKTI